VQIVALRFICFRLPDPDGVLDCGPQSATLIPLALHGSSQMSGARGGGGLGSNCSNSGINESNPQTPSNVIWISSKAELEISFMNSLLEK